MTTAIFLHRFRFHLEPKAALRMPTHYKDNLIHDGFEITYRRGDLYAVIVLVR